MTNARRQFLHLTAGALVLAALPACRNESSRAPAPRLGERFPELVLPNLDGRMMPFPGAPGAALVVNFWATWCEPCRREMPSLQRLNTHYRPEDLQVIGVTIDDDLNLAREFRLRYNLTFPQFSDRDQTLSREALHISAIPVTYLLTRDRRIARVIAGEHDWNDAAVLDEIEDALGLRRE